MEGAPAPARPPPGSGASLLLRMEARHLPALAALSGDPSLEARLEGEALTLRTRGAPSPALRRALERLPALERWERVEGGLLRRPGESVPLAREPDGPHLPLSRLLAPALPPHSRPAPPPAPMTLRVIRGGAALEPGLLLLPAARLLRWVEGAPEARLRPLAFALRGEPLAPPAGRAALVRGAPLPPLAGERFSEGEGISLPLGASLDPPLDLASARALLGLEPGALAVFFEEGGWERIPETAFRPLTRAALRRSLGPAPKAPPPARGRRA